ncbi:MAG TPA: hypothetical protein QF564_18820, partial [Pirellulaceae bacterium]|nr:hypothetical protein [Pirellulaceae bacterium]
RKNVDSHRHVQKTEPQLLFVSSQIHQGQTAKSTGPKPIERNSVNGYSKEKEEFERRKEFARRRGLERKDGSDRGRGLERKDVRG